MKLQMAKKRMIYTLAVAIIIVFSTTYAIIMTLERNDYRNYLQGQYGKSMYELVNSIENIEDSLAKSAIVGSREMCMVILQDIFRHSSRANDRLHSLPIPVETISETSTFLSQVGDYAFILTKARSEGRDLTDEEYANIDSLKEQSSTLKQQLNEALTDINQGRLQWGEIRQKATGVLARNNENNLSEKFKLIEKQVTQYPSLIYNGPFSDNTPQIQPKVEELKEVSKEEAMEITKNLLGSDKVESIKERPNNGETRIESFDFIVTMKGREEEESIVCEISKHGGKVVYLIDNKNITQPKIDEVKALEIGAQYLEKLGYKDMVSTYNLTYEDNMVIHYVYSMNEVMVYPDQVKLKIALDDGTVVGVESEKYLISHTDNRELPTVKVTEEEARKELNNRFSVNTVRLAVIPTEVNTEVVCYEYTGTYNDETFLFYVNAESGETERILKIVNTPNGQLTM
jgi:spore germination protein